MMEQEKLDMEEVYRAHFSMVYNYVFYRLLNKENTEDVVSQIFMKVMQHLNRFDPEKASLKTWIFRIAENSLIDFYRRQRPGISMDQEDAGLDRVLQVHFDDQYDQAFSSRRQAVLNALRQIHERDRMFVYCKYFLNISNREIAWRTHMNENTVSAVMARARKKLQAVLDAEGIMED